MADISITEQMQGLLERLNQGDRAAQQELIELAYQRMLRLAGRLRRTFPIEEEESMAVLHEAYLRLHSALEKLEKKPTSVRQFMGLVALEIRRVLLDSMRKIRGRGDIRRPMKVSNFQKPADGEHDTGGLIDPTDSQVPADPFLTLDLLQAIEKLAEQEREVVELLFFLGCTQPEAAEVLGVHEDTVKRRWGKAKRELALMLPGYE
jgi:RNA polymerase sigma factor (sigma-70 family)